MTDSDAGLLRDPHESTAQAPRQLISVVIVDDHVLIADAVATALSAAEDTVVRAVVATGAEGLAAVRQHQPDVCLLDQRLPDGLGTDLLAEYLVASPSTRIILVTASDSDDVLRAAIENGAAGFLAKGKRAHALAEAVRSAAEGGTVLSANDMRRLMPTTASASNRLGNDLTAREREILGLLARGASAAAVADELFISLATVRNHIQSVLTKLGAHSKLEAVTIALREGIVAGP
jgi:DNA-binding NarL/FixJ family response regulator